ncbi:MAG: hypothetical protein V4672_02350 [Verrucomicrobiota bacterium]
MSAASEFVLREVAVGLENASTDSKPYEIAEEDWQLALETRERWLKGEEETLTLAQLKEELRAELGWKS